MTTRTLAFGVVAAALWLGLPAAAQDARQFVEQANSSNMFEIESSKLALAATQEEELRAYAEQMIADHTAAGERMNVAAATEGFTPPVRMLEPHQENLLELQGLTGEAFEDAYVEAQVAAHDEAVMLFEEFSARDQESPLREIAVALLPVLKEHQAHIHSIAESRQ